MNNIELPLFDQAPPQPVYKQTTSNFNPQKSIENALLSIFPDFEQGNKIQNARKVLGESISEITDEQLESDISNFEFIVNSWLDIFERNIFGGKTLKDLLKVIHAYEK